MIYSNIYIFLSYFSATLELMLRVLAGLVAFELRKGFSCPA